MADSPDHLNMLTVELVKRRRRCRAACHRTGTRRRGLIRTEDYHQNGYENHPNQLILT
jgi:hypothetical protein